ncbi:MAG: hypothetical protein IJ769_11085 [Clostridia bacterium]|nr:hypothetical protein [Clostridia bacterium]
MRKPRSALCALCLALLVPLLIHAWHILPIDNAPLVAEKYAGWSGVLRLWVFEGWQSGAGSLSAWLNKCIARFEKRHPGVYVQPQTVEAGALSNLNDTGILPPDMLLFPPGVLDSPRGLLPLTAPDALRTELAHCGAWNGATYAVPVAMGGYIWAWNTALIDGIPGSWREIDAALAVPEAEPYRHWEAALLALCAGRYAKTPAEVETQSDIELPGMDLGLTAPETPAPRSTPEVAGETLPCRLPADFSFDGDAWRRFINGEAAALPVTQREVRRLQALSDQGKGPDWRLSATGAAFTDQLQCLSVVSKPDADAQRQLCLEFLDCLLEDESQGALGQAGAFSVTGALSGYPSTDPLAQMEAVLRGTGLAAPNCFDMAWPKSAESIVRKFIDDAAESSALWQSFADQLTKNPNINSWQLSKRAEIGSTNASI